MIEWSKQGWIPYNSEKCVKGYLPVADSGHPSTFPLACIPIPGNNTSSVQRIIDF